MIEGLVFLEIVVKDRQKIRYVKSGVQASIKVDHTNEFGFGYSSGQTSIFKITVQDTKSFASLEILHDKPQKLQELARFKLHLLPQIFLN